MARTRSARAHDLVVDAALKLFAERGLDATSMDAIAEASGVSKATIYKHWADKEALCLEAMARVHGREQTPSPPDTGDTRADIVAVLDYQPPEKYSEERMRIMPHLMAYATRNPSFGIAWRTRVLEPPRTQLVHLIERAKTKGELPRALNTDVAISLLLGPMTYRHMMKLMRIELPEDLATQVVDALWKAYGIAPARSRTRKRR